jgi:hypothetical protein
MMKLFASLSLLLVFACTQAQHNLDGKRTGKQPEEQSILDSLGVDLPMAYDSTFRFQMVFTPVVKGKIQRTYSYNTDLYYYPASLVKLPMAWLLLERLNQLNISLDATPVFDTSNACGSVRFVELSEQRISFRQMLKEMIAISDNHFYNAIYHFLTPEYIFYRLSELGFNDVFIFRAFTGCSPIENLQTYPCRVYTTEGTLCYQQSAKQLDATVLDSVYSISSLRKFGRWHENEAGEIVDGPFDLNQHLEVPLNRIHQMMLRFMFPDHYENRLQWKIRPSDRDFMMECIQAFPTEVSSVYRDLSKFHALDYKYANLEGSNYRTYGKLGLSYGFASEVVFIPTSTAKDGFMLSYSVYVNENETVNDGVYEYEEKARPFAKSLAEALYDWYRKQY